LGKFVKGEVVVVPFPFSDLTENKKRPALVVAELQGDDVILCLITSQKAKDSYAISLVKNDFANGSLPHDSNIRPNRLFTADSKIVLYKAGKLKDSKIQEVIDKIIEIFSE
jgi:mRNA interferase MazF